jgi:hypothetical protein
MLRCNLLFFITQFVLFTKKGLKHCLCGFGLCFPKKTGSTLNVLRLLPKLGLRRHYAFSSVSKITPERAMETTILQVFSICSKFALSKPPATAIMFPSLFQKVHCTVGCARAWEDWKTLITSLELFLKHS